MAENLDWAVATVMVISGAWNFWFQGPALAERGFSLEARVAAWGGLIMMIGAILLVLTVQIAYALMPFY